MQPYQIITNPTTCPPTPPCPPHYHLFSIHSHWEPSWGVITPICCMIFHLKWKCTRYPKNRFEFSKEISRGQINYQLRTLC